jgi:ubiquitin carboxyl-terminal hydrolase 4/11/15
MPDNRRDSLTLGDKTTTPPVGLEDREGDVSQASGTRSRSLSPAKRRAAEMDDETAVEEDGHMDLDGNATPLHNGHSKKEDGSIQSPESPSSKATSDREMRDVSVDLMLRGPQGDSNLLEQIKSSSNSSAASVATDPSSVSAIVLDKDLPSIDQQVATIMQHLAVEMRDGDIGYAISVSWLNRVLARSSERENHGPYEKDALEGDVGPIDNSSILLRGQFVKKYVTRSF